MNVFQRIARAIRNDAEISLSEARITDLLGGRVSKAGVVVTADNALKVGAAYACVNVISSAIANMPVNVYKRDPATGARVKARGDMRQTLLNTAWNEYLVAHRGWRITMVNALLTEAGYIEIERTNGRPTALYPVPSKFVTKHINPETLKPYFTVRIYAGGKTVEAYDLDYTDMIEIPGLASDPYSAYDPISLLAEALGLSAAAEQFAGEYFSEGTHPTGVITYPGSLNKARDEEFKKEIRSAYTGLGSKHRLMLLEEGMKFDRISISPNEGQMIDTRKFQVQEVARFFNVPPHKIQDLDRATWSNIEEQNLAFVQDTLMGWVRLIEQSLNHLLLFPQEIEAGMYVEFDLNTMLRGRIQDRYNAYQVGVMYGWLTPNQVCERENLPTFEGGDRHYLSANMLPISTDGSLDGGDGA